jgi:two-component system CheB/CheR fusion protein
VLVSDHTVAIHLYRIAQEAVSNALKHGQARRIEIGLTAKGRSLTLSVSDNGAGIPRQPPRQKGMGLRIMRYRAEVIGGAFKVEPHPGGGTRLVCTVAEGLLLPQEERNTK